MCFLVIKQSLECKNGWHVVRARCIDQIELARSALSGTVPSPLDLPDLPDRAFLVSLVCPAPPQLKVIPTHFDLQLLFSSFFSSRGQAPMAENISITICGDGGCGMWKMPESGQHSDARDLDRI